ncbi:MULTISPECIES: DUF397 domain-containing protein [unclassified Streptomyces]|uniref:DUF397 domain-containing protein n=1 Tax=unclassified Streptomyces TaxID=2593676 RepID=UPI00225C11E8|nr:DUF397 domain-containing protein [Streptomyces sp. NBC_00140]MCX5338298.1 DUF397 domain-containing protein [Streptomyces sp. NBC_00140]
MNHPTLPTYDARALAWHKSSYSSENGACVEIAQVPDGRVAVRDSKVHAGPHLALDAQAFGALVGGVVDGTV